METAGSVVIEDTNTTDLSVVQNITVSPFTSYTATVLAYTSAGRGDSLAEVVLSPEAGMVTVCRAGIPFIKHCTSICYTVPSPVQSLSVTFLLESATYNTMLRTFDISVNISWQQPQFPNGYITAYSYRLVETSNSSVEVIPNTNTTDSGLLVVQSVTVSPFTNYTATVVAYTSAGSGDSVIETALSPEAGKTNVVGELLGITVNCLKYLFGWCVS